MKELLRKLRLVDTMSIELDIEKSKFVDILRRNIDTNQSALFEVFSSSKNEYKGTVSFDSFELKRKRKFVDMNMNLAKVKGKLLQKGEKLLIDAEINAFQGHMALMFIFLIVFYLIFIIGFATSENMAGDNPGFVLPFILLHAILMLGIPYFMMRRSVTKMKYELERDLYFMTRK